MLVRHQSRMKFNVLAIMMLNYCAPARSFMPSTSRSCFSTMESAVPTATLKREMIWVNREGQKEEAPIKPQGAIKVVSYNMLGAKHGESSKHNYAPMHITKWTLRKLKLIEELERLNANIFCLQEITESSLHKTFIPSFKKLGLECAGFGLAKDELLPKSTSSNNSETMMSRKLLDPRTLGCAVFCDSNVVKVISSKRVFLRDFAPQGNSHSEEFSADVHSKSNIMVMLLLEIIETGQKVVLGNTHLFWDPKREDIKTMQGYAVAGALSKFCEVNGFSATDPPPIILCGDFNGMPYRPRKSSNNPGSDAAPVTDSRVPDSALFELLTSGTLAIDHPQHPDQWYRRVMPPLLCPHIGPLNTPWRLRNTFMLTPFVPFAPAFTTKTNDFAGWIDHIWVDEQQVEVTHTLMPPVCITDPCASQLSQDFPPMPNSKYASDHIPLGIIATLK